MARSKQQRTPARSTTAGTPSTAVSPIFSNKTSAQATPDTSDIDEDAPIKPSTRPKRTTRASSGANPKKRTAESDDDSDNDAEEKAAALPKKRRAVTRNAYVEIPVQKATRSAKITVSFNLPLYLDVSHDKIGQIGFRTASQE